MSLSIDYYLTLQSPWTYLGHARFGALATAAAAEVQVLPIDLGRIFPLSGGLPLPKRAPQRQAYRLVELQRWAAHLGLPINLQPAFFPVSGDDAARLVIAVREQDGADAAMDLCGALLRSVWVEERNIADTQTLAALLGSLGLPARRLDESREGAVQTLYDDASQQAIDHGIFGAPSYVVEGELFWGQDRLDFVQRRLA